MEILDWSRQVQKKSIIPDLSGLMWIHLWGLEEGLLAGVLKKGFLLGS